jgi:hypothetical protein
MAGAAGALMAPPFPILAAVIIFLASAVTSLHASDQIGGDGDGQGRAGEIQDPVRKSKMGPYLI